MLESLDRLTSRMEICSDAGGVAQALSEAVQRLLSPHSVAVVLAVPGLPQPVLAVAGHRGWGDSFLTLFDRYDRGEPPGDGWRRHVDVTGSVAPGSRLLFPLGRSSWLVGAVFLEAEPDRTWTSDERRAVRLLARMAAARAESLVLADQIRHDELTGAFSRRAILEELDTELRRAYRHGRTLAVGLVEIADLGEIQAEHGHGVRDGVLTEVARILRDSLRKSDQVGRVGNDRFLCVLPETPREGALHLGRKISRRFTLDPIRELEGKEIYVPLFLGLVSIPQDLPRMPAADEVARLAEKVLWDLKLEGAGEVGWAEWRDE